MTREQRPVGAELLRQAREHARARVRPGREAEPVDGPGFDAGLAVVTGVQDHAEAH